MSIGNSLVEADKIDVAKEILAKGGDKIVLPVDSVVAEKFDNDVPHKVVEGDIPDGYIGP